MKRQSPLSARKLFSILLPHRIMYPKPGRPMGLQPKIQSCKRDYSDSDVCRVERLLFDTHPVSNCLARFTNYTPKTLSTGLSMSRLRLYPRTAPVTDMSVLDVAHRRMGTPVSSHYNGEFYIFWGDRPGAFMEKAKDPKGSLERASFGDWKRIIDTTPWWDDDGRYIWFTLCRKPGRTEKCNYS